MTKLNIDSDVLFLWDLSAIGKNDLCKRARLHQLLFGKKQPSGKHTSGYLCSFKGNQRVPNFHHERIGHAGFILKSDYVNDKHVSELKNIFKNLRINVRLMHVVSNDYYTYNSKGIYN